MISRLRKIIASLCLLVFASWLLSFVFDRTLVKINYQSSGCFHSTQSTCIIKKQNDSLKVYLVLNDSIHEKTTLPLRYTDSIALFISRVKEIPPEAGCTTVSEYSIASSKERISKTDGTCHFHYYEQLIFSLFGKNLYDLSKG